MTAQVKNKHALVWALKINQEHIPALVLITLIETGKAYIHILMALISKRVIDHAVAGCWQQFRISSIQLIACVLGLVICTAEAIHLREKTSALMDRTWKKKLMHILLYADYPSVSAYHSGDLLNRLNQDVLRIDGGLLSFAPDICSMLTRFIASFAIVASFELEFSILLVSGIMILIGFAGIMRRFLKKLYIRISEADGRVLGFIQEILENLIVIQAMDVAEEIEKREEILLERRWKLQRIKKNKHILLSSGMSFVSNFTGMFSIIWCARSMIMGNMSFGTLVAITQLVEQMKIPMLGFANVISSLFVMEASAERLMELQDIQNCEAKALECKSLYKRMSGILAKNLRFSYEKGQEIVFPDFMISKNTFCSIVGPSGKGKSTLLKLMMGIYNPIDGELCIETQTSEQISLNRLTRGIFAYVPQGNLLFSGTLKENILLTNPDASQEEILHAVHVSGLDEWIAGLTKGLDTEIGENAIGISEGQAQRISIARAVLSDSPILLLDECTSALDADTERQVLQNLARLPDRTIIAVTHRPAALELSDTVISVMSEESEEQHDS